MIIHSKHLNQDFEVQDNAREDGVEGVISHEMLEDIILNQIPKSLGIQFEYNVVTANPAHSVVLCTMRDAEGRQTSAVGESSPKTLDTALALKYPTQMASKRAFDRAAKMYLNVEEDSSKYRDASRSNGQANITPPPVVYPSNETTGNESAAGSEVLGDTIVTIGAYKTNPTKISDIYISNRNWFDYIADKYVQSKSPELLEQADKMRKYRELMKQ